MDRRGPPRADRERLGSVFAYDRWTTPSDPVNILRGMHRDGAITGDRGPCDRACAMMWHADWRAIGGG